MSMVLNKAIIGGSRFSLPSYPFYTDQLRHTMDHRKRSCNLEPSSKISEDKTQRNGSTLEKNSPIHCKQQKYVLLVVFVSLIIDLLAFTLLLPLLPSILDYYQQHDRSRLYLSLEEAVRYFQTLVGIPNTVKWNTVLFGGMIGSIFSLLQFISSPIIGVASDVYGRKPLLLISMTGVAISHLIWSVSNTFLLFIIARIIGGISKGNISLSTAIVTDVSSAEKRGRGMALIGIAFSLGFIIGPFIGAMFSKSAGKQQGLFVLPGLFAFALILTDIMFIIFYLNESLPPGKRAKSLSSSWRQTSHLLNPMSLFRFTVVRPLKETDMSSIRIIGCVYFLYLFIFSGLEFTLTFLTHSRFGYSSLQKGIMFIYIGSIMALIQGSYTRRVPFGKEKKVACIVLQLWCHV
ncbi:facilitator superfamily domain-containing 10-like [Octopus vulgaris]|uniref:Facilitator superfamily domain-containing 10-like n=2 Tax=Octopus vulgaris TaxID=6645 RepID=A0AA36FH34_OCTVU|nr:facilitator superfamily domain-containing 10-like [Octopus vulgaris]